MVHRTWVALCLSLIACEPRSASPVTEPGDDVGVVQRLVYDFHDGSSEVRSFLRMRDGRRVPLETTQFATGTRLSLRNALRLDGETTTLLSASVTSVAGGTTSLAANLDPRLRGQQSSSRPTLSSSSVLLSIPARRPRYQRKSGSSPTRDARSLRRVGSSRSIYESS